MVSRVTVHSSLSTTPMSHLLPWSQPESLSTPLLDQEKEHERLADDGHNVTIALSQPSRRSVIYMFASLALNLVFATAIAWALANRASMVRWRGDPPVYSQSLAPPLYSPPSYIL